MIKFDLTIKNATEEEILNFLKRNTDISAGELIVENPEATREAAEEAAIAVGGQVMTTEEIMSTLPVAPGFAPVAPVVAPAQPEGVDALGLTWDARIHSKPAKFNKDGSYKKRRGLDDATYQTVRAELLGGGTAAENTMAAYNAIAPEIAPVPVAPIVPVAPAPLAPVAPITPAPLAPIAAVMGAPIVPVTPTPVPVAAVNTISTLLVRIQKAFGAGKITQQYLDDLVIKVNGQLGLNAAAVAEFASNQAALDTAINFMTADGN